MVCGLRHLFAPGRFSSKYKDGGETRHLAVWLDECCHHESLRVRLLGVTFARAFQACRIACSQLLPSQVCAAVITRQRAPRNADELLGQTALRAVTSRDRAKTTASDETT